MTLLEFVVLLIIAGLCGSIGRAISGGSKGGCLVSIAIGFVGAILGPWVANKLNLPELFTLEIGSRDFPVIWSIIGAALFVAAINLISGRR